jgi:hypothetical protein
MIVALALGISPAAASPAALDAGTRPHNAAATEPAKIFLVAIGDNGQSGMRIGCGDSLVPVTVQVEAASGTDVKIARAIAALLAIKQQYYGQSGLYDALYQSNLTVAGVSLLDGAAVVRLSGSLVVGGVCDEPRVEQQLAQTALQFPGVTNVSIVLNNGPLFQRPNVTFFPETGHTLRGGFRAYWNQFGGLAVFGFPLTEEFQENGLTVQYFERARFEWHPGAYPARYDVLLGRLGAIVATARGLNGTAAFQPKAANPSCTFYPQTGHNLCGGFRAYWNQFGGLAVYGFPISDEFKDPVTGLTVQYFERQRFEWQPGTWPERYDVLLGRLGYEALANGWR